MTTPAETFDLEMTGTMSPPKPPRPEEIDSLAGPIVEPPPAAVRVASVDALRGLTIFLMIFVNGMGTNAPAFLHHIRPPRADGMTLADMVFPWFLFIVGVSIPLAFESARRAGVGRWTQLGHILGRTAALLLMGVLVVNQEGPHRGERWWGLLAFASLILAWCSIPREPTARRQVLIWIKAAGVVGLIAALALFRRPAEAADILGYGHVEAWAWLRTEWWGILGLIGWAYLVGALVYGLVGARREWLMGAMGLLMLMHLAEHDGGFFDRVGDKPWLGPVAGGLMALKAGLDWLGSYVGLGETLGSLPAITVAGTLLGSILGSEGPVQAHGERLRWAGMFAAGLFLAGAMSDTFEGINKIAATPTWCFWSAGLAVVTWMLLYLVMDVAGFRAWSVVLRPAGANPLVAYFLHPITVAAVGLAGLPILDYTDSSDPNVVVGGAAGMALFVCVATGLLARLGLRVRL